MKKVLLIVGCAMFLAGVNFSCSSSEEAVEGENVEVVEEETAEPEAVTAQTTTEATASVNKEEILSKAREAGQAKCNCYKTDPASVESCIKAILEQSYAAYQNDADFQAEMKAEYNKCIKEKATAAAKDAANEGVKAAAGAISKKLGGKE